MKLFLRETFRAQKGARAFFAYAQRLVLSLGAVQSDVMNLIHADNISQNFELAAAHE